MSGDPGNTLLERLPEPNLVAMIWRRRVFVVLFAAAFAAAGILLTMNRTPRYIAEAGVLLADPRPNAEGAARDEVRHIADQVALMKSPRVMDEARRLAEATAGVQAAPEGKFASKASIEPSETSNFVVVRFEGRDDTRAKAGANAIVQAYRAMVVADLEADRRQVLARLDKAIAGASARIPSGPKSRPADKHFLAVIDRLEQRRADLRVEGALARDGVESFQPAIDTERAGASLRVSAFLSGILGLVIAVTLAAAFGVRRRQWSSPEEPAALLAAAMLGVIPDFRRERPKSSLPTLTAPETRAAEELRFLASALAPAKGATTNPMLAFAGSTRREGTSIVVANTAIAAAQAGLRVLAVDTDIEKHGLSQLLLGSASDSEAAEPDAGAGGSRPKNNAAPTRWVLGTRAGGKLELLAPPAAYWHTDGAVESRRLLETLESVRRQFDLVIVDLPALLDVSSANPLLLHADELVVVVRHGTSARRLAQAMNRLELLGIQPRGYVYNLGSVGRARPAAPKRGSPAPPARPGQRDRRLGVLRRTSSIGAILLLVIGAGAFKQLADGDDEGAAATPTPKAPGGSPTAVQRLEPTAPPTRTRRPRREATAEPARNREQRKATTADAPVLTAAPVETVVSARTVAAEAPSAPAQAAAPASTAAPAPAPSPPPARTPRDRPPRATPEPTEQPTTAFVDSG